MGKNTKNTTRKPADNKQQNKKKKTVGISNRSKPIKKIKKTAKKTNKPLTVDAKRKCFECGIKGCPTSKDAKVIVCVCVFYSCVIITSSQTIVRTITNSHSKYRHCSWKHPYCTKCWPVDMASKKPSVIGDFYIDELDHLPKSSRGSRKAKKQARKLKNIDEDIVQICAKNPLLRNKK